MFDYKAYGLQVRCRENIALQELYMQGRPNNPYPKSICPTRMMKDSPHYEVFSLLELNGADWLRQNFALTRYYKMSEFLNSKKNKAEKIVNLHKSIKTKGYGSGNFSDDLISILKYPFAFTRYGRKVDNLVPEVFGGHHRIGSLLSLGIDTANVIVLEDADEGSERCRGKIHELCRLEG